jgi:ammonium transporter, Amt family
MTGGPVIEIATAALLMRVGVMLYACGLSRAKNAASASMRCIMDFAVAAVCFWVIGTGLRFGISWFVGGQFLHRLDQFDKEPEILLSLCGVLMATGLAVATIGERSTGEFVAVVSALLGAIILPITGMLTDNATGWLSAHGFSDFAGASHLFLATGICAAVAAHLVGPRNGKYNRDGSSNAIPGHNLTFAAAGLLLMAVAWVPFLAAVSLDELSVHVVLCVLLTLAGSGLAGLLFGRIRYGKADVQLVFSAILAGLIAITAGADKLSAGAALLTGIIAGVLAPAAVLAMDLRAHIDDVAGAAAVAIVGGAWGTLAVGLLAPATSLAQRFSNTLSQIIGIVVITIVSGVASFVILFASSKFITVRATEADEFDGLDLAEHDVNAYPDFQQTTIKSYHLREA